MDNVEDFEEGDIVQLMVNTAWHVAGELAIVQKVIDFQIMHVIYENDNDPCIGLIQYFRKLPIDLLEMKLVSSLKN